MERNIANLDSWQKRAAIELPDGPQRVRGLAGSGKTIVLALKAAYLHTKDPSLRIVLTFQTRSLYQQFRRLVSQFSFEFAKEEPDWTKLTVIHSWGSRSFSGVYAEIADSVGAPIWDFDRAKRQFGSFQAFDGICQELLSHLRKKRNLRPLYDVVLIDEAQDLPQAFFECVFLMTKDPKRIVYAYDELQNLTDISMVSPEELFGSAPDGRPNVSLRNTPDRPKQDIILPVCYRNSPWALASAHGLGFGTSREAGLLQMFDDPHLWQQIGYEVSQGKLVKGREVGLRRADKATPAFFKDLLDADEAVEFKVFKTLAKELEWLSDSINDNIKSDELDHDDILIVVPEATQIRALAARIMKYLLAKNIRSHVVGVTASTDEVFTANSIAITSIFRAKGNEAPMVYVVGADYCASGFNLPRRRNILFTSMTRSRAWLRVSGVGAEMETVIGEFSSIQKADFVLKFRYPTDRELARMRTLHRDRSRDELEEIQMDLEGLARVVRRIKDGDIAIDALPREIRPIVRRLVDEAK